MILFETGHTLCPSYSYLVIFNWCIRSCIICDICILVHKVSLFPGLRCEHHNCYLRAAPGDVEPSSRGVHHRSKGLGFRSIRAPKLCTALWLLRSRPAHETGRARFKSGPTNSPVGTGHRRTPPDSLPCCSPLCTSVNSVARHRRDLSLMTSADTQR